MNVPAIPEDVRRFILTSISSVPYLEAMLLLHADREKEWEVEMVAGRLYVDPGKAGELLMQLSDAGVAAPTSSVRATYRYQPATQALGALIDQLALTYSRHLLEVTNLIHSTSSKRAQRFADAFKFRRDS